jgi:hypothetical protein
MAALQGGFLQPCISHADHHSLKRQLVGILRRQPLQGMSVPSERVWADVFEVFLSRRNDVNSISVLSPMGLSCSRLLKKRRDGRVAEGARLESVYTGNRIGGSNPSLSAITFVI